MCFIFSAFWSSQHSRPASETRHALGLPNCVAVAIILAAAAAPAFSQPRAAALESVRVSAGKEAVSFRTALEAGQVFLLKATGTIKVGSSRVDAAYGGFGAETGVDVQDPVPGAQAGGAASRKLWFGSPRLDHTYYMIVAGTGRPLTLRFLTDSARAGSGAVTVSLFRLSPAALTPPLETLLVPVMDRKVATVLKTHQSAVYLLQASGSGRVGGGGLGQGDAEYMDYKADGRGAVDIGDANTDYGLGADEADQSISPRLHKWVGAWRADHTYYQLFEGTGRPIQFFFYDVKGGYGDNSPTDTLTVKVFSAP